MDDNTGLIPVTPILFLLFRTTKVEMTRQIADKTVTIIGNNPFTSCLDWIQFKPLILISFI